MARKEGVLYAFDRSSLGLVIGGIIGFMGCPDGFHFKTTIIYATLIAAIAFIALPLLFSNTVRMAKNASPITDRLRVKHFACEQER
ncbi:MAG: hypothetical protein ACLRUZ_01435 [Faecalimonas sp.]